MRSGCERAARVSIAAMSFALCVATSAKAQQAPLLEGPGADRPQPERLEPEPEKPRIGSRVLPRIEIPEDDLADSALSGASIVVHAFAFSGNTVFTNEQLDRVVEGYVGGVRRYADLLEARDRITRAYIDAGYLNSGAVLPRQNFADGVVRIEITEGRIAEIEVTTSGRLREHYVESRLEGIDVFDVDDLRERLRRMKRDPGIDAVAAELLPGREPGQAHLAMTVDEAFPADGLVRVDNQASQSVGGIRGRAQVGLRNLSGWGDRVSIAFTQAEELTDLDVRIRAPVTRWDTTVEVIARRASSRIVEKEVDRLTDSGAIDDISSDTKAVGFRVRQPVLQLRGLEASAFFGGDWKRGDAFLTLDSGTEINAGDPDNDKSTAAVLRLGTEAMLRLRHRAFAARITASHGLDVLGATDDPSPGFADGVFTSGLFQLQMIEFLPWYGLRLQTRLDGQVASGQLLGLERFAVGGRATVRGYRENLLVKDEGFVASSELRVPLPTLWRLERFELGVFSDLGYGRNKRSGDRVSDTLWSAGLGLHARLTPGIRIALEWAKDLEDTRGVTGKELQDDGFHFGVELALP